MADFTNPFWSGLIGGVTLVSIFALLWFTWAQSHAKKRRDGDKPETMGHVWDGDLEEYNNPLPRWWLNLFYITLVWGIVYLLAYPGLGAFEGFLNWSQKEQYEGEMAAAEHVYGPLFERYRAQDLDTLIQDPDALLTGKRLFAAYCTQCHGSDGGGAPGFPDLTDDDWLYGATPDAIETTILNGRSGIMIAWAGILGDEGIGNVTAYVERLAGRDVDAAAAAAGKALFDVNCVACHGAQGKGNTVLGAPNLTDDIWLYGGTRSRIIESIAGGRNGQMPPHREFLGEAKSHLLAAYVYSFTRGNAPTGR